MTAQRAHIESPKKSIIIHAMFAQHIHAPGLGQSMVVTAVAIACDAPVAQSCILSRNLSQLIEQGHTNSSLLYVIYCARIRDLQAGSTQVAHITLRFQHRAQGDIIGL
jgi:hypothetical protein